VACGGTLSASHGALSCADRAEPVGVTLTYDNGGFTQTCVSQVSVVDVSPPTASCVAATELGVVAWDQHFAWRIGGGDFTIDTPIPGAALDAGSTDNCGVDSLTLTRADTLG